MHRYLIITGGSRGIGEKTIAQFLEAGWQIINISRSLCKIAGVKNFAIDLSSLAGLEKNAEKLINAVSPGLICLVHNAAHYKKDMINSLSLDNLQQTLTINVLAAAALNKILIPKMKQGSSIIYLGSTLSEKAVPNSASYVISKHAIIGLMRATCQDLSEQTIHTCCVCPGLVDTQLLHDTLDENTINWLIQHKVIAKRLINPEEIARLIYFCATHPVINGEVIHANLGQIAD